MTSQIFHYEVEPGSLVARIATPPLDIQIVEGEYLARFFELVTNANGNLEYLADMCDDLARDDLTKDDIVTWGIGETEVVGFIDEEGEFIAVDPENLPTEWLEDDQSA